MALTNTLNKPPNFYQSANALLLATILYPIENKCQLIPPPISPTISKLINISFVSNLQFSTIKAMEGLNQSTLN